MYQYHPVRRTQKTKYSKYEQYWPTEIFPYITVPFGVEGVKNIVVLPSLKQYVRHQILGTPQ